MKNHYLTILSLASLAVLAGCASNGNNQNAQNATEQQPAQPVDDGIDWEKPLYSLDKMGDTSTVYQYNASGKLVKVSYYSDNSEESYSTYYYDAAGNDTSCVSEDLEIGSYSKQFDSQNRVIAYKTHDLSSDVTSTYRYEGNKKITESESYSEESYKNVIETYFDADGNDTLEIDKSQLVRRADDTEPDYTVKPDIYTTRFTYVTINGKKVLKSSITNKETKDGQKFVSFKKDNEYDQYGRLTKSICVRDYGDGDPARTSTYTYSYDGNCKIEDNGYKTYYAKK